MIESALQRLLRQRVAFPLVLLAAGALLLVSEVSYDRADRALTETRQHVQAQVDMRRVLQLITDAETAQRGYVLTGSNDFLQPYKAAMEAMPKARRSVLAYLDQAGATESHRELQRLLETKLSEVETTVALRQAGNEESSRTIVQSGIGKEQMESLRALMDGLLTRAGDAAEASRATTLHTLALNRFGVALLMVLSVAGLFLYIRQSRALERARDEQQRFLQRERERLEDEVLARTAELRELARHLQTAREDERGHLARELHDEMGALLTTAKLDVARLRSKVAALPELGERLTHLAQSLNDCIALKRRIIEDLRPSALDNLGLPTALELLCREMATRLGVAVDATIAPLRLQPAAELAVFRFVQEALTNIGKYARARSVVVHVALGDGGPTVEVSDDGVGFDAAASLTGRHGLTGMRFRVESLGGRMAVDSTPGRGTTLRAELPREVLGEAPIEQTAHAPGPAAGNDAPNRSHRA